MVGIADQHPRPVEQGKIHTPPIHADSIWGGAIPRSKFGKTLFYARPQSQHIPKHAAKHVHRTIWKAMQFLQRKSMSVPVTADHPAAGSAEVNRNKMFSWFHRTRAYRLFMGKLLRSIRKTAQYSSSLRPTRDARPHLRSAHDQICAIAWTWLGEGFLNATESGCLTARRAQTRPLHPWRSPAGRSACSRSRNGP